MAAQNIRYAELTLTPWTSVQAGVPIEAYVEAVEDARVAAERDHGVRLRWIYDIPGESGLPAAEDTVRLRPAPRRPRTTLIGFGLGGPEVGVDRPQFKRRLRPGPRRRPAQRAARRRDDRAADGVGRAARPRRRAHRARHLVGAGPRPASPTSSSTGSRSRSAPPPTSRRARSTCSRTTRSAQLHDAGVLVTVNSDDPPMFGTTLNREYEIAADLLDLDEARHRRAGQERRAGLVPRRRRQVGARRPRSTRTPPAESSDREGRRARARSDDLGWGAPGRTRTCDHRIRSPTLYPAELRGRGIGTFRSIRGPVCRRRRGDPAAPGSRRTP